MSNSKMAGTFRSLSLSSLIFGILGGACYWWVPMGIVLSVAGLMFGFVDCMMAQRRSLDYRLSIFAMLLSAVALFLGIVIAYFGMQTVTFGGFYN